MKNLKEPEPNSESSTSGVHPSISPEITAIILTLNEEQNIVDCLNSLAWTDRQVVVDCYSDDETVQLAKSCGSEVIQVGFENFAQQRNAALQAIESDWVFFVDADERGTEALGLEINQVIANETKVAWYVPRHNYIFGNLTLGAGWYPDYQLRLFRYGSVHYERPVHEIAVVDGDIGYLSQPLIHINYRDRAHFHEKQRFYTEYDAGILREKGIRPKPYTFITQPLRQFWWRFVTLKGYRDGLHGLQLSLLMSYYEWLKYRLLARLWR